MRRATLRRAAALWLLLFGIYASTLDEWSEVKVIRNEFGRRDRVVAQIRPAGTGPHPYDWSEAA